MKKVQRIAVWSVLALAGLAAAYAAGGYWLLPYLVRTQGLPLLSEAVGARFGAQGIAFDPFGLVLEVHGFSLHDPRGRDFVEVAEATVDLDLSASLREKAWVLAGRIDGPAVKLMLDAQGQTNVGLFATGKSESGGGTIPFRIRRLVLGQGRLEFEDASRGQAYKLALESIALDLENLGPASQAHYRLSAAGKPGMTVQAAGDFGLQPLRSGGRLEVAGVDLAAVLAQYAPSESYAIRSARAGVKAAYRFDGAGKTALSVQEGEIRVDDFMLEQYQPPMSYSVGSARAGLKAAYAYGGKSALSVQGESLHFQQIELAQATAASPWFKSDALDLKGVQYTLGEDRIRLDSATLDQASLPLSRSSPPGSTQVSRLVVADLLCDWGKRSLEVGRLASEGAEFHLRRVSAETVLLDGLPEFPAGQGGKPETQAEAPRWNVQFDEIRLSGYRLGFRDESLEPPVDQRFAPLSLRIDDLSNEPGRQFRFFLDAAADRDGRIELDGQARLQPLEAEIRFGVDKLWLPGLKPYWKREVGFDLTQGRLNLWGDLALRQDGRLRLEYSGGADFTDLATVDKREGKDLLLWRSLKLDGMVFGTQPQRLSIRSIGIEKPYARVFIDSEGTLNLTRDLLAPEPAPPKSAAAARKPAADAGWPVVIGAVRVNDGRMDFTDLTLKPNFAAAIHSLAGTMSSLSSQADAKSDLFLQGRINASSPVQITGQLNPFRFAERTDIAMHFRDVNLTTLSPYSGKFAGYRIEKGKLNMDLHYRLTDRKLSADNKVILDHLVLGERVESAKATTLPVSLAVSLLKDSEGRIDIDLPVSGDLDDPRFSVRDLLGDAVTQLITKLVTSPFAVLGNLIPDGGEELGYVSFKPGQSNLERTEQEKLGKVAQALKLRPSLNLDIKGSADLARDREAIAETALLRQLKEARLFELRQSGQTPQDGQDPPLAEPDYARLLTQLCRRHQPDAPELRVLADDRREVLSGPMLDRVKRRMLEKWAVDELDLRLLAQARGESIRNFLVREGGLPDQRIYLLDVNLENLEPPATQEIRAFLSLSGS